MKHRYYVQRDDRQYPAVYFTKLADAKEYREKMNRQWLSHVEIIYSAKTHEVIL